MSPTKLIRKLGIDSDKPILLVTAGEALSNLIEAIEEYCPNLRVDEMTKEDLLSLLRDYGDCVVNYHPEDFHQERATLLKNFEILKRYGLTDEDYTCLDFC